MQSKCLPGADSVIQSVLSVANANAVMFTYLPPPNQLLNASTNLHETWYAQHDAWAHFSCVFHKSLPICLLLSTYILLLLLGNCSVKSFALTKNTHVPLGKLLDELFCMRSLSYEKEIGNNLFPEYLVEFQAIYWHEFLLPSCMAYVPLTSSFSTHSTFTVLGDEYKLASSLLYRLMFFFISLLHFD
jgi:hypothetical protein